MNDEASSEYWRKHYELWRQSSLTQRAYCDEQGLSFALFRQWRTRLSESGKITLCRPGTRRPDFKPVATNKVAKLPLPTTPSKPTKPHTEITLSLPGGVHLALWCHA